MDTDETKTDETPAEEITSENTSTEERVTPEDPTADAPAEAASQIESEKAPGAASLEPADAASKAADKEAEKVAAAATKAAEEEAALAQKHHQELMEHIDAMQGFDDGDVVRGTVVRIDRDEVLVDIGYKSEGVIPSRELSIKRDADPEDVVQLGEEIDALVLQKEDKDGRLILSKKRAEYEKSWIDIEKTFREGGRVTGKVIEVVKGGLILDIGLRGFLPASLVDLRRVKDLEQFVGQQIEAQVIEMDRNRNNVVLSRRKVLEEERRSERQEILAKLEKGQKLKGTVSSIVDFGAFVDLGGIDGLVHISELSWTHVEHPSEVAQVGQEVEVQVLDVDRDRERISLGLKQTQEDPWKQKVRDLPIGDVVKGRVTKLVPFGAFIEIMDGVEGLAHISELAHEHVEVPEQVVKVGDEVYVKIMDIDRDRRRISLSLKQVDMAPVDADEEIGEAVAAEEAAPAEAEEAEEASPGESDEAQAVEAKEEAAEDLPVEEAAPSETTFGETEAEQAAMTAEMEPDVVEAAEEFQEEHPEEGPLAPPDEEGERGKAPAAKSSKK